MSRFSRQRLKLRQSALPAWARQPSAMDLLGTLAHAVMNPRQLIEAYQEVHDIAEQSETDATDIDWIVVAGFRLDGDEVSSTYVTRLERTKALLAKHPRAALLISGAPGRRGRVSEALAGFEWLADHNTPLRWPIQLDHRAKNSAQNIYYAAHRITQRCGSVHNQHLAIVSNRFHLARLHTLAKHLGLTHTLIAAEAHTQHDGLAHLACWREAFALLYWRHRLAS